MRSNQGLVGTVLLAAAMCSSVAMSQPGGGPGGAGAGPCTNLGCKKVASMYSPGLPGPGGTPPYCLDFTQSNGRYVRNVWGFQGGTPCSLGGTQLAFKDPNAGCVPCTTAPDNPFAIEGSALGGGFMMVSYGNYGCKAGAGDPCQ